MRIDNHWLPSLLSAGLRTSWLLLLVVGINNVGFAQTVAYTNVTIESISDDKIENGTLVVDGDEIVAVGKDVDIPDNARVVSMKGMTIMPGMVDPYFVFKRGAGGGTRTIQFRGRTITVPNRGGGNIATGSFSWIAKYFYPYTFNFRPAMRSGITTGNLVSDGRGLSAFANVIGDGSKDLVFQEEGVLYAQVTNQTSAMDIIRRPLEGNNRRTANTRTQAAGRTGGTATANSDTSTTEYWKAVREGKSPLFVNVNNAAGVAHLLKAIKKHDKVKLVLVATGPNLFQSLDQIKENKNVTVVLQPGIDTVPFKSDLMNVSRMLAEREIPFAISMSLSGNQLQLSQDDPMFPLAMLVRNGLDRKTTLESVTIKPAELLGIEKTHGTLEKGKKANFLVFDGDPMETGSQLQKVFLDGKLTYEN